jgi:hypothetical protein
MKQLKELIRIDSHFRKSINLNLDLGSEERLNSYIPTRSSLVILKRYLKNIYEKSGEHATLFMGPYGKGKSHLLLVLISILQGKAQGILPKIEKTDRETAEMIRKISHEKRFFLPVIVSGGGTDLNRLFLYALKEALEREGMADIVPESNYSEALNTLKQWKWEYPKAYLRWQEYLKEEQETAEHMEARLDRMDEKAMEIFVKYYPKLTAGSKFFPMVQSDALKIYQEVSRGLQERYGCEGILLIFDEFSKYIEGHGKENFARDMKTLQDMCELAERGQNQQLHLILVAHKSIHAYEKGIDKSVKDAFMGVEGRLKEVRFHVSVRNHYELIGDTLAKQEPEFSEWFSRYKRETGYGKIAELSYGLPCFRKLFSEYAEFARVMERGCFPLTPVCACVLLHISEKAAQNERTIFTFLTGNEPGSLPGILEEGKDGWVGTEAVYDYFRSLFRDNQDQPKIHNEWLKAEYALKHTADLSEQKVIKTMALIRMLQNEEELPAVDLTIRLGIGMEESCYQAAMEGLKQRQVVMFRSSIGTYAFKNNIGINVEKEIREEIARQPLEFPVCRYLKQVSELDYVLPRQHNQKRSMTRYFQYEFLREEEFLSLDTAEFLFEEQFSDGKLLALICEEKPDYDAIGKKTEELREDRIAVLAPICAFDKMDCVRRLAAISCLKEQPKFTEENQVLLRELELYEEDMIFEVNASLERDFIPGEGGSFVFYQSKAARRFHSDLEFNRFLSEICENYYRFSPRVNHELLNIRQVSGQYLRARNKVVSALLQEQAEQFHKGTAPECMIYRAAFVRTGVMDAQFELDSGCGRILEEIDGFFLRCIGTSCSFGMLYQKLQGKDYGVRKGIMPLFLAQRLAMAEGIPVIYLQKKELEINETVLNLVNDFPQNYELYLEPESGRKDQYLKTLVEIFQIQEGICTTRQKRLAQIAEGMQKWYRSLPQYVMVTSDFPQRERNEIRRFRKLLKRSEINPRETLFEHLPELVKKNALVSSESSRCKLSEDGDLEYDLSETAEEIAHIKRCMEQAFSKLQRQMAADVKKIYGGKEQESLAGALGSWFWKHGSAGREKILSKNTHDMLEYLKELDTNDELEIISRLSKIVLDICMEDWNDETPEMFRKRLSDIKEETEHAADQEEGTKTIILLDEKGNDIRRSYEEVKDSTSSFLKNMIDEAMEDFEDTLETSQKVAVLVEVLQELLR